MTQQQWHFSVNWNIAWGGRGACYANELATVQEWLFSFCLKWPVSKRVCLTLYLLHLQKYLLLCYYCSYCFLILLLVFLLPQQLPLLLSIAVVVTSTLNYFACVLSLPEGMLICLYFTECSHTVYTAFLSPGQAKSLEPTVTVILPK